MGHKTTHTFWCDKCGCPISDKIKDLDKRMTIYSGFRDKNNVTTGHPWSLLFCKKCGKEEMERYKKICNSKKGQRSIGRIENG